MDTIFDRALSPERAAEYLGVKPETLKKWRQTGRTDLRYTKVGTRVVYRISELNRFLDANTVFQAPVGGAA